MNTRPMNVSASPKRSRPTWPLVLGLSGHPMPWITPEHMRLARELTEGNAATDTRRDTTRGSLLRRIVDALLQGMNAAGKAHAAARGLMLN